jgi:hypothetical protein
MATCKWCKKLCDDDSRSQRNKKKCVKRCSIYH